MADTDGIRTMDRAQFLAMLEEADLRISVGDIEIGRVKVLGTDGVTTAKVAATSTITEGDDAIAAHDPVMGTTADAAVVTSASGSVSGKLRGIISLLVTNVLGILGVTTGAALDADGAGTIQQYLRGMSKKLAGRKLGTTGQVVAINGTGARSTLLAPGLWRISPTVECWLRQGASTVTAAKETALSVYLAGGAIDFIPVTGASDGYVYFIAGNDPSAGVASITLEE